VRLTKPDLSAAERVQEAVGCLPARLEAALAADAPGIRRWTVRDFADAYRSGEVTPVQVAARFLAAVRESSGPGVSNMAFFISCDPDDVMRQAEESTLRYQRGTVYYYYYIPVHFFDG
jgi:hypothetical protein